MLKQLFVVAFSFIPYAGAAILTSSVLHLLEDTDSNNSMRGSVIGIIAGIIDMFSPILEGIWILVMLFLILGLSLLAIPFYVPILLLVLIIEIMMFVMVVLGWKTLR